MKTGYVYDIPQDKFEEEKSFEWISVFFDGTGGNRYNVEMNTDYANNPALFEEKLRQGKYGEEVAKLSPKEKQKLRELLADNDPLSSYNQEYTNITRLYQNYNKDEKETEAIYQTGVGTKTGKEDNTGAGASGDAYQGIRDQVEAAINQVVKRISKLKVQNIEKLGINVFGFSRGAACARYFIYKIFTHTKPETYRYDSLFYQTLRERLGSKFSGRIFINFVGLFDTVSSYGLMNMARRLITSSKADNNVKELHLNEVARAKYAVQISAADEYRLFFSLTNINSCGFHGLQLSFPGSHCDVGGGERGYEGTEGRNKNKTNADAEEQLLLESKDIITSHRTTDIEMWKDQWKKEGWFKESELESSVFYYQGRQYTKLWGQRKRVSKKYSYVPLHIMAGLACAPVRLTTVLYYGVKIDHDAIENDKYKIGVGDPVLSDTKKALLCYTEAMKQKVVGKWGSTKNVKEEKIIEQETKKMYDRNTWLRGYRQYVTGEDERELRHGYLHLSAKHGKDNNSIKDKPNLKNEKPYRNIYDG